MRHVPPRVRVDPWTEGSALHLIRWLHMGCFGDPQHSMADQTRTIAFACQPSAASPLGDGIVPQPVGLFHLMLFDVSGKRVRDVFSRSFDRNAGNPMWTPDSRRILFSTEDRVYQNVFAYDIASSRYSRLTTDRNITIGTLSRNGTRVAFTMESTTAPGEVFVSDLAATSPFSTGAASSSGGTTATRR